MVCPNTDAKAMIIALETPTPIVDPQYCWPSHGLLVITNGIQTNWPLLNSFKNRCCRLFTIIHDQIVDPSSWITPALYNLAEAVDMALHLRRWPRRSAGHAPHQRHTANDWSTGETDGNCKNLRAPRQYIDTVSWLKLILRHLLLMNSHTCIRVIDWNFLVCV